MKKNLTIQELSQSKWPNTIVQIFGENLVSAFLFGDCLEEGFSALENPWTVGIILKDSSPKEIEKLTPWISAASKDNIVFSHFWSSSEVLKSLDVFPLEYLEISNRHVRLCGITPLEGFAPKMEFLKAQCRRDWDGFLFHRRALLAEKVSGKGKMRQVDNCLRELTPLLNGLFYIAFGKYPESRQQVLDTIPALTPFNSPAGESGSLEKLFSAMQELVENFCTSPQA